MQARLAGRAAGGEVSAEQVAVAGHRGERASRDQRPGRGEVVDDGDPVEQPRERGAHGVGAGDHVEGVRRAVRQRRPAAHVVGRTGAEQQPGPAEVVLLEVADRRERGVGVGRRATASAALPRARRRRSRSRLRTVSSAATEPSSPETWSEAASRAPAPSLRLRPSSRASLRAASARGRARRAGASSRTLASRSVEVVELRRRPPRARRRAPPRPRRGRRPGSRGR